MPRRLRVYFVDRGHHFAGAFGAKPDTVPARGAEARVVEDLGARETTSFTGRPVARAATATSTVCICIEFFWPKPPPAKGEITSTCSGVRPSAIASHGGRLRHSACPREL